MPPSEWANPRPAPGADAAPGSLLPGYAKPRPDWFAVGSATVPGRSPAPLLARRHHNPPRARGAAVGGQRRVGRNPGRAPAGRPDSGPAREAGGGWFPPCRLCCGQRPDRRRSRAPQVRGGCGRRPGAARPAKRDLRRRVNRARRRTGRRSARSARCWHPIVAYAAVADRRRPGLVAHGSCRRAGRRRILARHPRAA